MQLRIGKRAKAQAARMEEWWVAHREDARGLFTDELEHTFHRLCATVEAGVRWPTARRPNLRRILMPRTRTHVYFAVDVQADTVHVIALWGAPRARPPKL